MKYGVLVALSLQATNLSVQIPLVWGNAPETPTERMSIFEKKKL
jgi:hypothetical protein